jgi:hypothetical protein
MSAPRRQSRSHVALRPFAGLEGWWLANGGVETQRTISVGRAKLTVCYKVHVIPSRRPTYKASITVWPRARRRFTSRLQLGWHPDLLRMGWYQASAREFRQHGYHGTWRWSPWGRFGDFWKSLKEPGSLAKEAHKLERLRDVSRLPHGPSNITLQRTGARDARSGR